MSFWELSGCEDRFQDVPVASARVIGSCRLLATLLPRDRSTEDLVRRWILRSDRRIQNLGSRAAEPGPDHLALQVDV